MTERDDTHLAYLEEMISLDPPTDPPVEEWWFSVTEDEREFSSSMSAAAAARFDDPERLFALWRRDAVTELQQRHIEDRIARVRRHLQNGTGARQVE
jgi:hypothetical protein